MGIVSVLGGISFLAAASLLIAFFITSNRTADRMSNWFFSAFYALLGATAILVHREYAADAPWIWVLTVAVLIALAVSLVATLLVALRRIEFTRTAVAITLAFVVILLWIGAVGVLVLTEGGLPTGLGWLGIIIVVASLTTIGVMARDREIFTGRKVPGPGLNAAFGVIMAAMAAWLIWLGAA